MLILHIFCSNILDILEVNMKRIRTSDLEFLLEIKNMQLGTYKSKTNYCN